ncbi:low molecular weight protein-tyrosine-phosphatase [Halobacillus sp. ACCC02827]|uniref:low molecular weight protein-tyrosine-phosphatase n=1 Tax=Bacillaceae TaxID=186817 RepID=UPI0002A50FAE|nr:MULTISPECIES: low molecular weight protein-tyrosine-phosphatase [Bacillaceae]ELK48913.1 protein-tyrosine-phosphatase [Halobacillus sp. BAB-2008]QHT45760.1 low molecular weight phosphotyrosine protein phosphatase [Bacillus sp. SB49]WJE16560.1 low molecular weight protein-tyrosine-phosphatase [Halobacillus sp. ACCC02827]
MIHVLFVCLGNICRSPMAEAVFRDLVKREKLEGKITVDSAGIGHWHVGSSPHEGTRQILSSKNISYDGIQARQVKEADWDDFDYIIAMDDKNMKDLNAIRVKNDVTIRKLMDYVPDAKEEEVPDPYFTGNFEYVYELVYDGCLRLLQDIKQKNNL